MMFCAQIAHMVKLQADELMSRGFKEQTKQKNIKKKWFQDVSRCFKCICQQWMSLRS